jgi:broad specificity phosphatase PhoE
MPPITLIARHGETEWSAAGRHTGRTDVPLSGRGEADARALGTRLRGLEIALVLCSPLRRAMRTCELAGLGDRAEADRDLAEWDYGAYEGLTTAEILGERPGWRLFRDGCPRGEAPEQVAGRADRVIARARVARGDTLLFSSGHIGRMIAARWLGLAPIGGEYLVLSTASLSTLAYEHDSRDEPVIRIWNDTSHLGR